MEISSNLLNFQLGKLAQVQRHIQNSSKPLKWKAIFVKSSSIDNVGFDVKMLLRRNLISLAQDLVIMESFWCLNLFRREMTAVSVS